jgi:thiol:disulfide interchange protein DsbD
MLLRLLLLCCVVLGQAQAVDFLEVDKAFRFSARMKDAQTIEVRYDIARGYYMYRDNFRFAVEGAQLGAPQIPPGKQKYDPNFQKTLDTHRDAVVILLPVQGAGSTVTLKSTSQGCADAGVCYPPNTQSVTLRVAGGAPASSAPGKPSGSDLFRKPG